MTKKPLLSIIIVSFNTKKLTLQCIKSIQNFKPNFSYEIIIIDNASNDESVVAIRKLKISNLKLKINVNNLGFAKANNIGVKKSRGKYILLLNSDTQITKNSLDDLINFAEITPEAGVIVPKLLNSDKTSQPSVYHLPTIKNAILQYWLGKKGAYEKYIPKGNNPVEIEAAVAAAFLITPKALKKVGLLNPKYFMYFEDLDYCRNVRSKNLKIYYLPNVYVIHHHGASGKSLKSFQNQWRRLIPSSKLYHGTIKHHILWFILWSSQKFAKLRK